MVLHTIPFSGALHLMSVEANVVYSLAQEIGFSPEICKMALEKTKNNLNEARRLLTKWRREQTSDSTNKRLPGAVCSYFDSDVKAGAVVKVTCTDQYLAGSKEFYEYVSSFNAEIVRFGKPQLTEAIREQLQQKYNCTINTQFVRLEKSHPNSLLTTYQHRDQIAVIVETAVTKAAAITELPFKQFSFNCALHVAAFNPIAVRDSEIPNEIKATMTRSIEKQLMQNGKSIQQCAITTASKINEWAKQRSLLSQIFIKNEKESVREIRNQISEKIGTDVTILRFARFAMDS